MKKILACCVIALTAAACNSSQKGAVQKIPAAQEQTGTGQTSYCTGSKILEDGIGGIKYPANPKYGKLARLGEIFTANDCGSGRLAEVNGNRENFEGGSFIVLNASPTPDLLSVLQSVGFVCSAGGPAVSCKEWKLDKPVKLEQILRLQPYWKLFEREDCVICG